MRHALLISEFISTPWAIEPSRLTVLAAMVARWAAGKDAGGDVMAGVHADSAIVAARKDSAARTGGGNIAVLPMYGVVSQRPNMDVCGPGVMSTQQFSQSLRAALADDSIGGIIIDVDSPGGSVYGVSELGEEIYRARSQKPIIGYANSLAASAGYWLPCAASEFYITPGGEAGSIGVWSAHEDWSKALAEAGVTTTLISAGKYKTEGNPYTPLDSDSLAFMQSRVDDYYAAFTKAVAKYRGVSVDAVRNGMGQGRVLGAQQAVSEKMVDGIMTFDEVIKRMSKLIKSGGSAGAGAVSDGSNIIASTEETPVPLIAQGVTEPHSAPVTESKAARIAARRREMEILSA